MPSLVTSLDPSALVLGLLALAAFGAGWVDAIAGGGGVITVPALLAAGLPPHVALGTNKGQSVFGSAIALLRFSRGGWVDARRALSAFPASFIGALVGAQLVLFMSAQMLKPIVLALLVLVAVFLTVRSPRASDAKNASTTESQTRSRPSSSQWAALIALIIGTYDGFFGPGTGTFLIVAHVLTFNESLTHASANAKVVNFASNLASVILFGLRGTIAWKIALPMAIAQTAGSYLGARFAMTGGERVVRPIVLGVVLVLVSKLAYDLMS